MSDNAINKLIVAISACALLIGLGIMLIMPQCSAPKLVQATNENTTENVEEATEAAEELDPDNAYEYTALPSRITSVTADEVEITETTYEYDEVGNLLRQHFVNNETGDENTAEYSDYDEFGYPHKAVFDGDMVVEYSYEMDGEHATKRIGSDGKETAYTYYDDGSIDQEIESLPDGTTITTSYDTDGKILLVVKRSGESVDMTEYIWQCGEGGLPMSTTVINTVDGEVAGEKNFELAYDSQRRLMSVVDEEGFIVYRAEHTLVPQPSPNALVQSKKVQFL